MEDTHKVHTGNFVCDSWSIESFGLCPPLMLSSDPLSVLIWRAYLKPLPLFATSKGEASLGGPECVVCSCCWASCSFAIISRQVIKEACIEVMDWRPQIPHWSFSSLTFPLGFLIAELLCLKLRYHRIAHRIACERGTRTGGTWKEDNL